LSTIESKYRAILQTKRDKKQEWNIKKHANTTKEGETKTKKHRRFVERNKWKKTQDRKKLKPITSIYNYTNLELSEAMTRVLNRGLNFCINPLKLNLTEILVDYRKFERKLRWKEFFSDNDELQTNEWTPGVFPKEKTNLPNKNSKGLNTFINGVRSELTGISYNKTRSNIPKDETEAVKKLIELQKTKQIIIKPCDKGAGIIVCDYNDYIKEATMHLESKVKPNSPETYYKEINVKEFESAKNTIDKTLKSAFTRQEITQEEYTQCVQKTRDQESSTNFSKYIKNTHPQIYHQVDL
jgi:hypothetical protein